MAAENPPHTPERICALYSQGPHFIRMLKRLRAEYPDETIVAAIPPTYPAALVEGLVNQTLVLHKKASLNRVVSAITVLRVLRQARCSHIVVMFDSPRLNLLARLSGAAKRWCFVADGRLKPLSQSLPRVLLAPLWLRLCGQMDYLRARTGTGRRSRSHD